MYAPEDLQRLIKAGDNALLLTDNGHDHGTQLFVSKGDVVSLKASNKEELPSYTTGAYKITLETAQALESIEQGINKGTFTHIVQKEGYFFCVVYPWDILTVQKYFLEKAELAYFIHPDAKVHETAYIAENVVIGADVVVGEEVELQDVCLFPGVQVGDFTRIHGSVLANNVQVESDTIVDGTSHKETLEVHTVDGIKKKIVPTYSGVFAAPKSKLKGFYTEVTVIS